LTLYDIKYFVTKVYLNLNKRSLRMKNDLQK
ncbi:MAG: hypothetical protein ACI920_003449, partial [Saprospiraceae bacterium]